MIRKPTTVLLAIVRVAAAVLPGAAAMAQLPPTPPVPARETLALRHVNVVDVVRGRILPDRDVLIRDGRIVSVAALRTLPRDARAIDARGKYVIPGLWDMHVHFDAGGIATNVFFPLFLANGITGVREMASDCVDRPACAHAMTIDTVRAWRADIAAGVRSGPRIVASSPMLDGPHPIWGNGHPLGSAADARSAVRRFRARGVDFLKVYSLVPRESFAALASAARAVHLPFDGHVPIDVPTLEATNAGMRTMEHGYGLQEGCSRNESSLRAAQRRRIDSAVASGAQEIAIEPLYVEQFSRALASFDRTRCTALIAAFRRNGTAQTPTLVMMRSVALQDDPRRRDANRDRYVPAVLMNAWERPGTMAPDVADPFGTRIERLAWLQERVAQMQRAGVSILAGTDVGNPFVYPGFAIHDELRLLVQAGLTPVEALRAATINPARVLGLADSLGSIAAGKRADLVLLDANPLDDVANADRIFGVVADGRYFERAVLDRMLERVQAISRQPY